MTPIIRRAVDVLQAYAITNISIIISFTSLKFTILISKRFFPIMGVEYRSVFNFALHEK